MKKHLYILSFIFAMLLGRSSGFGQITINLPAAGAGTANPAGNNVLIYDNGGPSANYTSGLSGYVYLTAQAGSTITISGSYDTEGSWDYFKIFTGNGTGGTLVSNVSGSSTWFTYTGAVGTGLTIQLTSDGSTVYTGLSLLVTYSSTSTLNIPAAGNNSVTCGTNTILFDNGGRAGSYTANIDGYTVLNCSGTGQINVRGTFYTESGWDFIRIYAGVGTGGALLATYSGAGYYNGTQYSVNYTGAVGQALTVRFNSDGTTHYNGFELASIYLTGCCVAPNISVQPGSQTACPGDNITFSVTASGTGLTYQWRKDGINIGGATGSSFNIPSVVAGDAASTPGYDVVVTGTCGNITSSAATLGVNAATPAVPGAITGTTAQCASTTGQTYSISAVSNATTYTWTVPAGWSITAGTGTTAITVTTGTVGQNGNITVTAGNSCGTSAAATLAVTVAAASTPIAGPDQYICSATTSATMAASGTGTWTQVTGAAATITTPTSASSTITGLASGTYVFRWTAGCGGVYDDVIIIRQ